MKIHRLSLLSICCFSTLAFADNPGQVGPSPKEDVPAVTSPQIMHFEDLKVACQNPARFHNQVAPANIQVACQDSQLKWLPDTAGTVSMATARKVTTSVISDKYSVSPYSQSVTSAPQVTSCNQFKQILESVDTVAAVTCPEIIAFTGNGTEYCSSMVNALRAANPTSVKSQATGHTMSLCNNAVYDDGRGQH